MPKPCYLAITAAIAISVPAAAQACRAYRPADERVAQGYRSGAISAVALVRITGARYTREPIGDGHPWQASASIIRVLRGSYPQGGVSFTRGWGSAACDDGRPLPATGEQWVVYFWKRAPGDQPVWQSYPAEVAFAADPTIAHRSR